MGSNIYILREVLFMKLFITLLAMLILATLSAMPASSQASKYWQEKADQLYINGSYKDAATAYSKALELNPSDSVLWNSHGMALLFGLNDSLNAIKSFDKALELNSSLAEAWSNRGIALFKIDRYEESISSLNRATALDPNSYDSWTFLGMSQASVGDYQNAINDFDKAIQINPNDARAWNNKGVVFEIYTYGEQTVVMPITKKVQKVPNKMKDYKKGKRG